ncbi:hypothetical protein D9M71_821540 [compost metagenome]
MPSAVTSNSRLLMMINSPIMSRSLAKYLARFSSMVSLLHTRRLGSFFSSAASACFITSSRRLGSATRMM